MAPPRHQESAVPTDAGLAARHCVSVAYDVVVRHLKLSEATKRGPEGYVGYSEPFEGIKHAINKFGAYPSHAYHGVVGRSFGDDDQLAKVKTYVLVYLTPHIPEEDLAVREAVMSIMGDKYVEYRPDEKVRAPRKERKPRDKTSNSDAYFAESDQAEAPYVDPIKRVTWKSASSWVPTVVQESPERPLQGSVSDAKIKVAQSPTPPSQRPVEDRSARLPRWWRTFSLKLYEHEDAYTVAHPTDAALTAYRKCPDTTTVAALIEAITDVVAFMQQKELMNHKLRLSVNDVLSDLKR